ncbi:hypothetical protein ABZP36_030027 [Zizania latifolia]
MENPNRRPTQELDPNAVAVFVAVFTAAGGIDPNAPAPAGGDWRAQLQPEARNRIVNKIQSLPGVNPTSTLQNMSGIAQNTMNNGLAQGGSQDIYAQRPWL